MYKKNLENIAYQLKIFKPDLILIKNKDYNEYVYLLARIDEILKISKIDLNFARHYYYRECTKAESEGIDPSSVKQDKCIEIGILAFRCNIIKVLTSKSYRDLSILLVESQSLQKFCNIGNFGEVPKVPTKSSLQRYINILTDFDVRAQIVNLIHQVTGEANPLQLEKEITTKRIYIDGTCIKADIHFPVDWILLKDCMHTILGSILVIRNHGLKHRIASPESFLSEINAMCMSMCSLGKNRNGKVARKKKFRELRKLGRRIKEHGVRYHHLLKTERERTDLSEAEAQQTLNRLEKMIDLLPRAVNQATTRILQEKQVDNKDKILSAYHENINVLKRGKSGADLEFGNALFIAEQEEGLIVDYQLYSQDIKDPQATKESILRMTEEAGYDIDMVTGDRGCQSIRNDNLLVKKDILSGLCPRNPLEFAEKLMDENFSRAQKRRGQTEARIGILKNVFLDGSLYERTFEGKEIKVSLAVLVHNLWVLARLPKRQPQEYKKAA